MAIKQNQMKRYFAFYGDNFYPLGGMEDFLGHYDSIMECEISIANEHLINRPDDEDWEWAWGHIWDCEEMKMVG